MTYAPVKLNCRVCGDPLTRAFQIKNPICGPCKLEQKPVYKRKLRDPFYEPKVDPNPILRHQIKNGQVKKCKCGLWIGAVKRCGACLALEQMKKDGMKTDNKKEFRNYKYVRVPK